MGAEYEPYTCDLDKGPYDSTKPILTKAYGSKKLYWTYSEKQP